MTNQLMTSLLWTIAICDCLLSRIVAPFLKVIFAQLTEPMHTSTRILPVLTVAVADVPTPITTKAKPRPARRRRSSAKCPVSTRLTPPINQIVVGQQKLSDETDNATGPPSL